MPALNDSDKERVRYHLGYMDTSLAASIQLGIPRPVQTIFLVEDAMGLLASTQAVNRVICILDTMDKIETQLRGAIGTLAIDSVDKIQFHPLRAQGKLFTDSLESEYTRWAFRLADVLGVPIYPYSARFRKRGPGSNVPVSS
jgi:hypothetical protein